VGLVVPARSTYEVVLSAVLCRCVVLPVRNQTRSQSAKIEAWLGWLLLLGTSPKTSMQKATPGLVFLNVLHGSTVPDAKLACSK
jgi:hypothetical protein